MAASGQSNPTMRASVVGGAPSAEEATAAIAAVEQFLRDTAAPSAPDRGPAAWREAALLEAVGVHAGVGPWGHTHPGLL